MSMNIRFPNITGKTEAEQLAQIRSYLHQLVQQLNWMLSSNVSAPGSESSGASSPDISPAVAELKAQVFRATNALDGYYSQVNTKLEDYVPKGTFDAYQTEMSQRFDGLGGQYVSNDGFEAYKADLGERLASSFTNLQQQIDHLKQIVQETQDIGGD